ncbi:MAG: hypothetical protein WAT36_11215 [Chromatiaceae bacterium]
MKFVDYAASRILKTLLSVFFQRTTLMGPQFSYNQFIRHACFFAHHLDENKTENDELNEIAVQVAEGLLLGFYQNQPGNKNWSAMVHHGKIKRFVGDSYRIAELMLQFSRNQEVQPEK